MPLTPEEISRVKNSNVLGTKQQSSNTPSAGTFNASNLNKREIYKQNYSNVSNDVWYKVFGGEEGTDMRNKFFRLMDGYNYDNLQKLKTTQSTAYNYFKKAHSYGEQISNLLNSSFVIGEDGKTYLSENYDQANFESKLKTLQNNFFSYHSLGEQATLKSFNVPKDVKVTDTKAIEKIIKSGVAYTDLDDNHLFYDAESGKFLKNKDFKIKNQEVKRSDNFWSDVKPEKDNSRGLFGYLGTGNWIDMIMEKATGFDANDAQLTQKLGETHGYKAWIKETGIHPVLKQKVNFLTSNWLQRGLDLTAMPYNKSQGNFKSETEYLKNQQNTIYLIGDIIKGGINSNNKEVKQQALKLNSIFWDKNLSKVERRKLLSDGDFRQKIENLYDNKGYSNYNKISIYKSHKERFNNKRYIQTDNLNTIANQLKVDVDVAKGMRLNRLNNEISQYLKINDDYQKSYRDTKEDMIDKFVNQSTRVDQSYFNSLMFNKNKDVIDFESFWNKVPTDGFRSDLYTNSVKKYIDVYNRTLSLQNQDYEGSGIVAVSNAQRTAERAVGEKGTAEFELFKNLFDIKTGKKLSRSSSQFAESYNNHKLEYKKSWNQFHADHSHQLASAGFGLGATGNFSIFHDGIDLKSDGKKSTIANNFILNVSKLTESPGSAVYAKSGKWNYLESITDYQEEGASEKSNKVINDFFKNKDKTTYRMDYVNKMRDSGFALYMFTDEKSKKQLSVVLPLQTAKSFNDIFAKTNYDDSDDFHFDLTGTQSLDIFGADDYSEYVKDARIENVKGQKVFKAYDKINEETISFPLGDNNFVRFDDAVRQSIDIIRTYANQ